MLVDEATQETSMHANEGEILEIAPPGGKTTEPPRDPTTPADKNVEARDEESPLRNILRAMRGKGKAQSAKTKSSKKKPSPLPKEPTPEPSENEEFEKEQEEEGE